MGGPASFQSHAGSIEAAPPAPAGGSSPQFQSHAGSIEAGNDDLGVILPLLSFNPTLVRLRPDRTPKAIREEDQVSIPRWFD